MPLESYCLDDISLIELFDISDSPREDIRSLLDAAAQILNHGNIIVVPSSIDDTPVGQGLLFQDLLYVLDFSQSGVQYGLDRDIWIELMTFRGRLEEIHIDAPLTASLYKMPSTCVRTEMNSSSAAIICAHPDNGERFALLLVGSNTPDSGEYEFRFNGGLCRTIYAIKKKDETSFYVRWLIEERNVTKDQFFSLWETAFPNLQKSDDLSFRRFHGNFTALRDDVVNHLGFLNDHFLTLWQQCNMDFPSVMARARSGCHIDLSNESSKTRRSKSKMKKRVAHFSGKPVVCELHTKVRPNINRIHFHPPISDIALKKMLIGIFVDHLET